VVVDLWASWCGPCRTLGPTLEKVVGETGGQVEWPRSDVDCESAGRATFQSSRSRPFSPSRTARSSTVSWGPAEPAVRQFVDKLGGGPSEVDKLIQAGDEASLRKVLELEPGNEQAVLALASRLGPDQETRDEAWTVGSHPGDGRSPSHRRRGQGR